MANNTVYHFVGSNLVVEIFLRNSEHQKKGALKQRIEAPLYTLYWVFIIILCKGCLLFYCFLVIKRILKGLFSFIPWLLNSSDLPSYGSNLRKRYTLKLSSMCLGSRTPHIGGKALPFNSLLDSLRWVPFSLSLYLCFS